MDLNTPASRRERRKGERERDSDLSPRPSPSSAHVNGVFFFFFKNSVCTIGSYWGVDIALLWKKNKRTYSRMLVA